MDCVENAARVLKKFFDDRRANASAAKRGGDIKAAYAADGSVVGEGVAIKATKAADVGADFGEVSTFAGLVEAIVAIGPFLDETIDHFAPINAGVGGDSGEWVERCKRFDDEL